MVEAHRVRIPLEGRWVASGARVIQAKLELLVQTSKADFASLDFIVDTGCGITSIPRTMAEERGILIPTEDKIKTIGVRSSIGSQEQRVRLGKIGVRVPGLASRIFYWACHFVEPPLRRIRPCSGSRECSKTCDWSLTARTPSRILPEYSSSR
jgi:hypothetical protein